FPYAGVHRFACYCSDRIVSDRKDYLDTNADNSCTEKCPGHLNQICGGGDGSEAYLSVYRVIALGSVPGFVLPFRPNLAGLSNGPYCFFRDSRNSLSASYCNIPYCQISHNNDCLRTNDASQADDLQMARYSGFVNFTESGEGCMDWRSFRVLVLSGNLNYTWDISYSANRV
uniref:WSC domain-containing protein n=1 Tax=Macrostomum lignano TaxID=282301 RepID=A0A1I8HZ70_9PLAT